jgi:hypothetical protein
MSKHRQSKESGAPKSNGHYMWLINCQTPEEVYATTRRWTSDLTEREHLVRSTILDIHADVERLMKQVLYQLLLTIMFKGDDNDEYRKRCSELWETVTRLNFATVHRVLKIPFEAFPASELADISAINEVRNEVAHQERMADVKYKGRKPFCEAECMAQLFFEAWAVRQALSHFYERMIDEPRFLAAEYAKFYHEKGGQ